MLIVVLHLDYYVHCLLPPSPAQHILPLLPTILSPNNALSPPRWPHRLSLLSLLPRVFGWLLCMSSSNGGRPSNNIEYIYIFVCYCVVPIITWQDDKTSPIHSNPCATSSSSNSSNQRFCLPSPTPIWLSFITSSSSSLVAFHWRNHSSHGFLTKPSAYGIAHDVRMKRLQADYASQRHRPWNQLSAIMTMVAEE